MKLKQLFESDQHLTFNTPEEMIEYGKKHPLLYGNTWLDPYLFITDIPKSVTSDQIQAILKKALPPHLYDEISRIGNYVQVMSDLDIHDEAYGFGDYINELKAYTMTIKEFIKQEHDRIQGWYSDDFDE